MEETNPEALAHIWSAVLAETKKTTSASYFAAFLQDTKLLSIVSGTATVSVKNVFIKAQIVARLDSDLKKALNAKKLKVKKIDYITSSIKKSTRAKSPGLSLPTKKSPSPQLANNRSGSNLNQRYSFDNFVDSFNTQEVFAACQAIATSPGRQGYNPLFIYGGVGLGKTHLIQATGNAIIKNHPEMQVLYITANDFLKDFVDSIRSRKKFDDKYRSYDCLIIDDIQHFSGKTQTQESFFHTFNSLYQDNKQIILSSDRPPSAIKTLANRLQSRFEQGLTFDIQMPNIETRIAIIEAKAAERNVPFNPEVIEYIAKNCHTSVRQIEGVINKLCAVYELCQAKPTIEAAKNIIREPARHKEKQLSTGQIIEKIAHLFGLQVGDVRGSRRVKDIAEIRHLIMYFLYSEGLSYTKIGAEFNKDHTSVLHAVRKIRKLLDANDQHTKEQVDLVTRSLYV